MSDDYIAVVALVAGVAALAAAIVITRRADHTCWLCGADTRGGKPHKRGCTREATR